MQIFDTIVTACKKGASKAKELAIKAKDKALALLVGTSATVGAVQSKAAGIAVAEGTGFTGSIDSVYYLTAVGIVVSFLGIAVAIGLGIRALKKA